MEAAQTNISFSMKTPWFLSKSPRAAVSWWIVKHRSDWQWRWLTWGTARLRPSPWPGLTLQPGPVTAILPDFQIYFPTSFHCGFSLVQSWDFRWENKGHIFRASLGLSEGCFKVLKVLSWPRWAPFLGVWLPLPKASSATVQLCNPGAVCWENSKGVGERRQMDHWGPLQLGGHV